MRARLRWLLFACLLTAGLAPRASADDSGITEARLFELEGGRYALEADVPAATLAALRPPIVPERFEAIGRPEYRPLGFGLTARYEFGGSDRPLGAGDRLLLPWGRSAVLLTARWRDGEVQRAMFVRGPAGIPIDVAELRPVEHGPFEHMRAQAGAAFSGAGGLWLRVLLVLALVAAAGRAAPGRVAWLGAGYGVAMVLLDLGVPPLDRALGLAGLGLGAVLLARAALRGDEARLGALLVAVGLVDGLGLASGLGPASGLGTEGPDSLLFSYYGAALPLCVALLPAVALARAVPLVCSGTTAAAVGCLAVAGGLVAFDVGLGERERFARAGPPPELRLDLLAAGPGAGAAPPRRLEDPALVFVTVEPREVRLEVLLSLADFLAPLSIEGGPDSVVPVAVQEAIAARALKLVGESAPVTIDGRPAAALLERTDFVTVSPTGVSTRSEPAPEPVATSVLGVTRVFGVERPPTSLQPRVARVPGRRRGRSRDGHRARRLAALRARTGERVAPLGRRPPVTRTAAGRGRRRARARSLGGLARALRAGGRRGGHVPSEAPSGWRGDRRAGRVCVPRVPVRAAARPVARRGALASLGRAPVAGGGPAAHERVPLLRTARRGRDLRPARDQRRRRRARGGLPGEPARARAGEPRRRPGARGRGRGARPATPSTRRRRRRRVPRAKRAWTVSGSVNHFGHVHYRQQPLRSRA